MKDACGKIEIEKAEKRYCIGYYDLFNRKNIPCTFYEELTGSEYTQCKQCKIKSGVSLCLGCNGSVCKTNSDKAKQFCNQEHYVYLAYFPNDKLKVGTAVYYRRHERLLEQGAIYSIFLAKTKNGKLARRLETEISNIGIVQKVNTSYKINNIIINRNSEDIKNILINEYENIKNKIDEGYKSYLTEPEYNNFEIIYNIVKENLIKKTEQINLFGDNEVEECIDYKKILNPEYIKGEIIATIGNLILLKEDNIYSVLNMKKLEGWEVKVKK